MKVKSIIKDNLVLILIFLVAALVRVWNVPNGLIFFDDAGHDLRVAAQNLATKQIPLLGIESSVPRFRQGPVTIWFEMGLQSLFGYNLTLIGLGFICLSLLALVLVYEYCDRYFGQRVSIIATSLIALSPLAVAQARMPYHTNPIPLAVILYLFSLVRLYEEKPHSIFWAFLAWAFLFQFELAIFPTILVIFWVLYQTKRIKFRLDKSLMTDVGEASAGLLIGLLPQLLYDATHNFSQMGLFIVWIGYRLVSLFGGEHSFSLTRLGGTLSSFAQYGGRIFSVDRLPIGLIFLGLIAWSIWTLFKEWRKKKISPAIEVVAIFFLILTGGYLLHGSPSEAYFPPYIIILPLMIAYALNHFFKTKSAIITLLIVIWAAINLHDIFKGNFFVSSNQSFSYGCSVKHQRELVDFVINSSGGNFRFDTTREMRKFKATFDNLRWLAEESGRPENQQSKRYYYVEGLTSPLQLDAELKVKHFACQDLYYYE